MASPRRSKRPVRPIARLIGSRIRSLREARDLTQEKLAWEAGLSSKGYLSRIEDGQRLPSVEVLERLSRRLEVEARDLLIFPDRGPVDEAMELLRRGGPEMAKRVLAGVEIEPSGEAKPPGRKRSR